MTTQSDNELLGVFLEEAVEVLGTIKATLPACREKPDDHEALTTVRRAFHTLKGSGRMVGLKDFGEAAWEVEQVMNGWLEQKRPASPPLLAMIGGAAAAFAEWVAAPAKLGGPLDISRVVELAKRARTPPDEVTVGSVTVPRGLYDIYTKEAAEHIAVLEAECAKWRAAVPAEASQDFMRAAHTLASTSRTAGFAGVAGVAAALEQWSESSGQTTEARDADTVQAAVRDLKAMIEQGLQVVTLGGPLFAFDDEH